MCDGRVCQARRLLTTRHLSFALVHGLIINHTTLKTGSINCHVFCILLSGNTITYQSQWPSRVAGSPFPQQKGGETTGSPQKSSTPLPRLVIRPPKAPASVKRATPFTGKELFEAAIKIKLLGREGGSRGEVWATRSPPCV
jgi:hypothetical protein